LALEKRQGQAAAAVAMPGSRKDEQQLLLAAVAAGAVAAALAPCCAKVLWCLGNQQQPLLGVQALQPGAQTLSAHLAYVAPVCNQVGPLPAHHMCWCPAAAVADVGALLLACQALLETIQEVLLLATRALH